MEQQPNATNKKRSLGYLAAAELSWKLKSKADLLQYLDKHSKSPLIFGLVRSLPDPILIQSSTTSPMSTWSPTTS